MSTSESTDFKKKLDQIIQKECCNVLYECNQQYIAKYAYPKNCAVTEFLHEIENVDYKTDDHEIKEMYFEELNEVEDIIDKWLICVLK